MTPDPAIIDAPRLSLACLPTPLQPLERVSQRYGRGRRVWVKRDDLSGSVLGGNKIRKLEYTLAHARDKGCDTLITCGAVQSNHCRATALAGAQLGMQVHLILRGEEQAVPDGNLLLDELAGAAISIYSTKEYQQKLPALFAHWDAHYQAQGRRCWHIPTGASDGIGLWGYINACAELKQDFKQQGIERAHIVCATGSGGTQAGLTLGAALYDLPVKVWGVAVCDDADYFQRKVRSDIAQWSERYCDGSLPLPIAPHTLDSYIGPGYGKAGTAVFALIREMAALEGIVLDPVYTAKAFYGMVQELAQGRFDDADDVVFIHTGGVFGLFPQRDSLRI